MCRSENRQAVVIGRIRRVREAERSGCLIHALAGPILKLGVLDEIQWESS